MIGQLLQKPLADLDLSRIAAELEDIAKWLRNRSVNVGGQSSIPSPGQFLTPGGDLRTNIGDPMEAFIAGIGRS
jgi:hypothetical protein